MNDRLNESQQRWLAIGLLMGIIVLVAVAIVWPVLSKGFEYKEAIEELVFKIQRYKRIVASQDEVLKKVEDTQKQIDQQGYFSTHDTVALASAELQKFLKQAIVDSGGQLTSTQVLPQREQGELTRLTVKIRLSGTIDMLRNVLYEIETAKPLLIIEKLDIRPVRGKRNRKTRKIEPSNKLNINLEIASFMRRVN